jgi:hypothetical protein
MMFVVAGILMLVIVGIVVIFILAMMGGNNQLHNAVGSGALSVARRALTDIYVKEDMGDQEFLEDVVNKRGELNAENYNRTVAKTMLVSINEMAMASLGQSTPTSSHQVLHVFERQRRLGNKLQAALDDDDKLGQFFDNCANANDMRMFGNPKVVMQKPVDHAYMDRGAKSSVYFAPNDLPEGFNSGMLQPLTKNNKSWLPGYLPLELNGCGFCFTPQPSAPPHLVSKVNFAANQRKPELARNLPAANCLPIIPNSFRVTGTVEKHNQKLSSTACSEADALTPGYPMSLPQGFVRITQAAPEFVVRWHENVPVKRFGRMVGMWAAGDGEPPKPCLKPYTTQLIKELEAEPNAWDRLVGDEYTDYTVNQRRRYEQRGKEIVSGTSLDKHDPPFAQCKLAEPGRAYLFRLRNKLAFRAADDADVGHEAPWLLERGERKPDGIGGFNDSSSVTRIEMKPSVPLPKECAKAVKIHTEYRWYWTPATGVEGILGELSMSRKCTIRYLGDGPAPDPSMFENFGRN